MSGELASRSGEHQRAHEICQRGIDRIEENLRIRNFPGEKAFYGEVLARFGNVLARDGEIKLGVEYIKRGLQIMNPLLNFNLFLHGDLSAEISEAENNLRHCSHNPSPETEEISKRGIISSLRYLNTARAQNRGRGRLRSA